MGICVKMQFYFFFAYLYILRMLFKVVVVYTLPNHIFALQLTYFMMGCISLEKNNIQFPVQQACLMLST
jgi:hypothetical protein